MITRTRIAAVEHRRGDAAQEPIVPEAAVAHHEMVRFSITGATAPPRPATCRSPGWSAEIERRQSREEWQPMSLEMWTLPTSALEQLDGREPRTLGATDAEAGA